MSGIINLRNYTDALRNTGYKNTESAISEIVDNSLEAKAKDVLIICTEGSSRGVNAVEEIAILDNGIGMDDEALKKCLVIGESTRKERKGMGRFGVGLPQASLHVCPRVEVYSWQGKDKIRSVYLDINKIKSGDQETVVFSKNSKIPERYDKYFKNLELKGIEMDFNKSGTLVIWKNCDRLKPKKYTFIFERFKRLLGRKFRHFINEGKSNIALIVHNVSDKDELLRPNDPLCLMQDNMVLGDPRESTVLQRDGGGEPIFEPWVEGDTLGEIEKDIPYLDQMGNKKVGKVQIKFSWVKEIYRTTGFSEIGSFLKKNTGISIVRANREIDFGKFDFFSDVNEPQHRWWGCEIKFDPDLDEVFGVSNNKQQVELFELRLEDYDEEEFKPVWFELNSIIGPEIKKIYKKLGAKQKRKRSKKKGTSPEELLVNEVERNNKVLTASDYHKSKISSDERKELIKKRLINESDPDPSDEKIKLAFDSKVKLDYKDLGDNSTFIDIDSRMGTSWLTINQGSLFYRELYSKLEGKDDESIIRAFNLIIMAFARAEDESYNNQDLYKSFKDVREQWGIKLRKYLSGDYQA